MRDEHRCFNELMYRKIEESGIFNVCMDLRVLKVSSERGKKKIKKIKRFLREDKD